MPGTPQAQEAVIASSLPETAAIKRSEVKLTPPKYDGGSPQLKPIEGTPLSYVVNSPYPVIQVSPTSYYALQNGIWFVAPAPQGLWQVATSVPPVIYSIPPSSPLHYVTYDLQPLVTAALAARRHNRNWLSERAANGATLAAALDWLTPFALGQKTHEEFVHSSVPFDAKRREAGLPGYTGEWDPKNAAELFHLAARLDGRFAPVALKLAPTPPAWLAVCLPLPAR